MMITTLYVIGVLAAVMSSLFFIFIYRGWMLALRIPPERPDPRAVTVVIAAHNEAEALPELLHALDVQDFPRELLEIIVVDDRSTDGSAEVTRSAVPALPLRVLRIDETPSGVSPKKWALHHGILAADHEIVLLTDADCIPRPGWIRAMSALIIEEEHVVMGLAPLSSGTSRAGSFAAFESRRTMTLATAAAASGVPYMVSGRSWGFHRALYERCGGLPALYAHLGGDDDLLLQRMLQYGATLHVCVRQEAMVFSQPPATWNALFRQKQRHYRVSSSYRGKPALLLGAFVFSETLTPLAAITLTALLPGPERMLPLLFWLWKLWYDTGFLQHAFRWMEGDARRIPLVFREGFHIFFSTLNGVISFVKPQRW
ncbi:MAG: glycosyltransferase [Bacteroidetes bacterium]|nr:glycosyltransferase [Bacteroidota bacterium]